MLVAKNRTQQGMHMSDDNWVARATSASTVLIVEDDPHFRDAFVAAVQGAAHLRVAGVAADLANGLRLLDEVAPDVALVDLGLPGGSGIELIRHARRHVPRCEVMVVTVFADEQVVFQCIEAGATGYLLKESSGVDIVAQIRMLLEGGSPITPSVARHLLTRMAPRPGPTARARMPDVVLSNQERAVLQLCAKGYNYEEIGQLLNLSRHTVETYVKRTYRKLQVHSKTEAVYEGRKLGFVAD